jgi:hypothetical protein
VGVNVLRRFSLTRQESEFCANAQVAPITSCRPESRDRVADHTFRSFRAIIRRGVDNVDSQLNASKYASFQPRIRLIVDGTEVRAYTK